MPSVDDRVVAMHFDNKDFEKKLVDTIGSIDKLKLSLDFTNSSNGLAGQTKAIIGSMDKMKGSLDFSNSKKGLGDLVAAGKGFHLDGIARAVEGIGSKFSAMGAIAFTVIQNITNRALDLGITLSKSFSLDQVLTGFREYELNLNSIQTILANTASKGTTLFDVNSALDQLNTYSDKTIYNFGQMAKNIGTFTAAGVDLDTSVSSIKGIANLAALSGSSAEQASGGMYQLSQALATGTLRLMDWKSVETAGFGGEVFQKSLFETGKALGTLKDVPLTQTFEEWEAANGSFRSSLEQEWITSDVLTATLQGFTGDLTEAQLLTIGYTQAQAAEIQKMGVIAVESATVVKTFTQLLGTVKETVGSSWSQSFRIIIGDFEEAKALWTGVNDTLGAMVGRSADARNELLTGWKDLGGRTLLIKALGNAFNALNSFLRPIKEAFREIFPKQTAQSLFKLTERFEKFTKSLTLSWETAVVVKRIFKGVFAAFQIGFEIVKGITGVFGDLWDRFGKSDKGSGGFLGFLANLGDGIVKLRDALVDGKQIKAFFEKIPGLIAEFFSTLDFGSFEGILASFEGFKELLLGIFKAFDLTALEGIKTFLSGIFDGIDPEMSNSLEGGFGRLGDRLSWLWEQMKTAGGIFQWFWEKFGTLKDIVVGVISTIATAIKDIDFVQMFSDAILSEEFDKVLELVQTVIAGIFVGAFSGFQKNGLGLNVDLTGGFLGNLNKTTETIGRSFEGINKAISGLTGVLTTMQANLKADTLMKIGVGIALITASVLVLSMIDSAALGKALTSMAAGFGELIGVLVLLSILISGPLTAVKLAITGAALILLGSAMIVFSIAMRSLSELDWEELAKGLGGVAALLGALSIAVKPLSANSAGMITAGLGMIAIGVALNIMALAVKSLAELDWESMGKGLAGVAGGLLAITIAMKLMPEKGMLLAGLGILAISVALNIMALAVKSFAELDWADMGKGMAGVAAIMLLIAGALAIMPNGALLALQGAGILAIGVGLFGMSMAIRSLGGMKWKDLGKGIAGIAATLMILSAAMMTMSGTIIGAVAIAILAPALILLAVAIKAFAKLSWLEMIKGIAGLALALGALALAAHLMTTATVVLLGLGAALLLIGAGFALFGIGAFFVATAFALVVDALVSGYKVISEILVAFVKQLPDLIVAFGKGIILLAELIIAALPRIIGSLDNVIAAIFDLLIRNIPKFGEVIKTFILTILDVILEVTPQIIAGGIALLLALLQGIRDNIGEVVTLVAEIITEFLTALADKVDDIVAGGLAVLVSFLKGIADNIDDVVVAAVSVLTSFLGGIADGAVDIIAAGTDIIVKIIEGIGEAMTDVTTAAADTIVAFLDGLDDNILKVVDAGWDFIISLIDGITASIDENLPKLRAAGIKLAGAIADGMTFGLAGKLGDIVGGIDNISGSILDKFNERFNVGSPSKVMIHLAEMLAAGLVIGFDNDNTASKSARNLSDRVVTTFQNSLSQIPTALEGINEFNPTITPVLDLTNVRHEARNLLGILGHVPSFGATLALDQARVISSSTNVEREEGESIDKLAGPREIKFEQHNHSPEPLSTADIYRQTRNQIAMAKEELSVL